MGTEAGQKFYNDYFKGYAEVAEQFFNKDILSVFNIPALHEPLDVCSSIELHRLLREYFDGFFNFINGRYDLGPNEANTLQRIEDGISNMKQINDQTLNEAHMQMMEPPHKLPCMGPFVS